MSTETYQGWTNRETWAFNLHWTNDPGLYEIVCAEAARFLLMSPDADDTRLGDHIVATVHDIVDEDETGALAMVSDEVGSWWRVNAREVGEAVREAVA